MNRKLKSAILMVFAAGSVAAADAPKGASTVAPMSAGFNPAYFDNGVRVQDDLFLHVNGTWLKTTEIPADKSAWGAGAELREETLPRLRGIIEATAKTNPAAGTEAQKIVDLYTSFINEDKLEALGIKPLAAEFARVDAITDKKQIPALMGYLDRGGVNVPYNLQVHQDNRDSTRYIVDLGQSGLGLPDRDYYLKDDDARLKEARDKYQLHVKKMLGMAGDQNAAQEAKDILALETELAKVQWTKVENRDPVKAYNKVELANLDALAPGYDWPSYQSAAGINGKVTYVIISQPSYITGFNQILQKTPLTTWKTYFKWQVLSSFSPYLSKQYSFEHFAFYGTALRGIPEQEPRWKRALGLVEGGMGEGLGKLYVAQYFPPENKARMEKLVGNLLAAYRSSIDKIDWMSPATKKEAKAKLATFMPKIGYPSQWRDYSTLSINKDDLVANVRAANDFEYQRNLNKLGQPIDRTEWGMTPQTINAYYNPELNEIVFPAAILQPPYFNVAADDAVNYGSIGAVIGHEISHGFDDQGSQYDGAGNLRDWWTKEDHAKFAAKTAALVKQYNGYSPVPGYPINGELTLGENIADNSGLAIAYKAYHISLGGKSAPVIDGYTGDQRFYMGFGQAWRAKVRDATTIVRIKSDPHSPPQFRADGTVKNQPAFYTAFGVKPGDKMYLPPKERVIIW